MQTLGRIPNPDDKYLGIPQGQQLKKVIAGLPKHFKVSKDIWVLAKYRQDKIKFRPRHIIDDLENLWKENYSCNLNPAKTVLPEKIVINDNVIVLDGIKEGLKHHVAGADHTDTLFDYCSVGTDGTAEAESQNSGLIAELSGAPYARRQFSTGGQAKVVNQTMKLSVTFNDSQINPVPSTLREAGVHWAASGANNIYARVAFSAFTVNTGDLFVIQINELDANGTL